MNVFNHSCYKSYIREKIRSFPANGRGLYRKISTALDMHTTLVSQVFSGGRHLTPEQALKLTQFFGLSPLETDMFCLLVDKDRAGTQQLKKRIEQKIDEIQGKSRSIGHRVPQDRRLTEAEQSVFYSDWFYTAINLLTSIKGFQTVETISQRLDLPAAKAARVLEFLCQINLVAEVEPGTYKMGTNKIHLSRDSPLISRHHSNWRMRAIQHSPKVAEDELMFTAPMSLSVQDANKIQDKLLKLVDEVYEIVESSKEEELVVLNMDFFRV